MKGRLLASRRTCVSIGDKYTLCLNKKSNIFVFENSQISSAAIRMHETRTYTDGMFFEGVMRFEIVYLLKEEQFAGKGIPVREISVGIKQCQTEMAYEEYRRLGIELITGSAN